MMIFRVGSDSRAGRWPLPYPPGMLGCSCTDLQRCQTEIAIKNRARWAYFRLPSEACPCPDQRTDYRRGWVAGYIDVAQGADGTPPALAPDPYLKPTFFSPRNEVATRAWFQGFHDGAEQAARDGAVDYWAIVSPHHEVAGPSTNGHVPPGPAIGANTHARTDACAAHRAATSNCSAARTRAGPCGTDSRSRSRNACTGAGSRTGTAERRNRTVRTSETRAVPES